MAPVGSLLVLCEDKIREKSGLAPHHDLGAWWPAGGRGPWLRVRAPRQRVRSEAPAQGPGGSRAITGLGGDAVGVPGPVGVPVRGGGGGGAVQRRVGGGGLGWGPCREDVGRGGRRRGGDEVGDLTIAM